MKIAAYARVSTGSDEQYTSFVNQLQYFTNKIASEGNELTKFYHDKGLSGTNFNRPGFIEMLYDAGIDNVKVNGQDVFVTSDRTPLFNVIYVKSTSRLARNTDLTHIIKLLKTKGVDIYFDDLNKKASEVDSELLINILIILDEQYSKDLSKKMRFGFMESAKKKPLLTNILGYRRDGDDVIIVEEEAKIVRKIFDLFVNENMGTAMIKNYLNEHGYTNRLGNRFSAIMVRNILKNEKYIGTYKFNVRNTIRQGNKKVKVEVDKEKQIIRENAFKAIIDKDTFYKAQEKLKKSAKGVRYNVNKYHKKIICDNCGSYYNRLYTGRYGCHKKIIEGKDKCDAKYIGNKDIEQFLNKTLKTFDTEIAAKINTFISILENYRDETYDINNTNITNEKKRLVDLYIKEIIDEDIYKEKLNKLLAMEKKNEVINDINNEITKLKNYNFIRKPQNVDELLELITIHVKNNGKLYYKVNLSNNLRKLANRFTGFNEYYERCIKTFEEHKIN